MKAKNVTLIIMLILFSAGTGLYAGPGSVDSRPYIGVLLDTAPLPDLLVKHLGLSPGQGIRIKNVHRDGPGDKAGLERDDIIIGFQSKEVDNYEAFINGIRKAGVGAKVSLEIIHLGQRKPITLTLEALEGEFDLKYPLEPDVVQSWRPGKIFRLKPGDEKWMEVLKDAVPPELDMHINKFFNEMYTYHHSANGEDYTITIDGNPNKDDSKITVQAGDKKYETTVGYISKLPDKYHESAEQAVKNARKDIKERNSITNRQGLRFMPEDWKSHIDRIKPYQHFDMPSFEPDGPMFDRIEKQMKELQERLGRLERRLGRPGDSDEPQKQESEEDKEKIPLEQGDKKSV